MNDSVTQAAKAYLSTPINHTPLIVSVDGTFDSIIEDATNAGMTLTDFVSLDPTAAIVKAQKIWDYWLKVNSSAAIEGMIHTEDGAFKVTRETTKLISERCKEAARQYDMIVKIADSTYVNGEQRKDRLVRTLYNRAVDEGNIKALTYLIDRVDGRPAETSEQTFDYDNAYNVYQVIHGLFDKQLEVLNSGSGTKLICCSRRAGKSHMLCAAVLIEALRKPNTVCIYIGETMELTENIMDSTINVIVDECGLKDKKGRRLNWKSLDNGSKILVRGLSNTKDPDQIRGFKAKVIVIDEFFHLKSELLEYLQREVLQPMQMDYADDYMFLCAGTPPSIKGTFGEFAWKTWDVPHFTWTYKDNPHPVDVASREAYVDRVLKEKGLDRTSTYARREYGGEWIYDEDLLLYPEFHTYNIHEGFPNDYHIDMVLIGIDYGVGDNDSIIGIAWDTAARRGYEFKEDKFNRLDMKDKSISQLEYLKERVRTTWEESLDFFPNMSAHDANKRILWDADDSDQHVTDEFNMNIRLANHPELRLQIANAHKVDKVMMFDKIKDLLRTASLLLIDGGKVASECEKTVLKRGVGGQVYPEVDDKVYHPDLLPPMRYALYNVIGQEAAKR
jgi:hypothetical protein